MRKLSLILGSLAVAGTLAVGSQPVKAATYHSGNPSAVRGYWKTSAYKGVYYVFHFTKYYNNNHAVVKTSHGWHTPKGDTAINPVNTFNYPARYRKLSAHTYYVIPTKKSAKEGARWHYRGADRMKIYKKSSKKIGIKYHFTKGGWSSYQWLYKK